MGKKSKAPGIEVPSIPDQQTDPVTSDGPSEEELNSLQTRSSSLQHKLDLLAELAIANNREEFVNQFVPLDLTPAEVAGCLADLTTEAEADGQWNTLTAEIAAITAGSKVNKIEGDQVSNAVFYFQHPLFEGCDREVAFRCIDGEWRAEG
jgi:hypothetical protein